MFSAGNGGFEYSMTTKTEIKDRFKTRNILVPILLGLLAASWLLYSNLTEPFFEEDPAGKYEWVDTNADGSVDYHDETEFELVEKGQYSKVEPLERLGQIAWTPLVGFWLLVALLMVVARDLGYMIRIRILTDGELSWRQSFDVIMMWEFASALTPSVVGGSGVAVFILNREGLNLGRSTAIVLITALLDELFYIFTVPVVLLFLSGKMLFPELDYVHVPTVFALGFGFIVLLTTLILFGVFFRPRTFKFFLLRIFSLPFLRKWRSKFATVGDDIMAASKEFKGKPFSFWVKAFGATFLSWTARYWVVNFLMVAFFVVEDHFLVYGRQLVMWVIMLISPTPGGSGVAEVAFTGFLGDQMDLAFVGVLAIVWRLLTYYPYLFVGAIVFPRWLKQTAKRKATSSQ